MKTLILKYPSRRDDIIRFVKKHHYSRRCPGVWSVAYALENECGRLQAVTLYGPPPYPSVARAFVRDPTHVQNLAWQARMVGAGISAAQLDRLIQESNLDLAARGFWWVYTLTDPVAKVVDGALLRLRCDGYSGEVYHRNHFLYLGQTEKSLLEGWLIDGKPYHIRQGAITLTYTNIHQHFPDAKEVRAIRGNPKQRWAAILAETERKRSERLLLMRYRPQPWQALTQPRLFFQPFNFAWFQMKERTYV